MPKSHHNGGYKVRREQAARGKPRFYTRPGANLDSAEFKKGCENKKKLSNKKWAKARAKALTKKLGIVCNSYHCRMCGFFHVGRKRDPVTREVITVTKLEKREGIEC